MPPSHATAPVVGPRHFAGAGQNPAVPLRWLSGPEGERDYLDGRVVRAGNVVELKLRGASGWLLVRYELVPGEDRGDGRRGLNTVFHLALDGGRWAVFEVLSEAGVTACASMAALAEQLRMVSARLQERLEEISHG